MGVEVHGNSVVTEVDYMGVTVKDKETGEERRINCACKVWAAGVQASPLGETLAEQSDGTEIDRAGRVVVEPDLSIKGHPNVFVLGDMASVPNVPGVAQGAIQGAKYATKTIKRMIAGTDDPATRVPFKYFDKGSMATISRHHAVAKVGKVEVPAKQWPELVDGLVSASLAEGVALTTKAASLTALGYLCEEVQDPDDIEQAARDKILAAIVNNCAPTAVLEVRRAAIKGLLHSLDFAECVATRRRRSGRPRRAAPLRRQAAAPPCRRAAVPPRPLFPPQGKLWRRARERARRHRQRGVRVHVRRERRRGAPGGV
jgi:hypothetical protein